MTPSTLLSIYLRRSIWRNRSIHCRSTRWRAAWRRCASAVGACSSSASAAAPATPRTQSTTSASSAGSRATRRPTTCPSSRRAPTTTAGRRRSASGWRSRAFARATRCSSSPSAAGSREHNVSMNLVTRWRRARDAGASIYGVVGAPGGTLAELADVAILIAPPPALSTPLVESFQAVVWHALVSHPRAGRQAGPLGVARSRVPRVSGRPARRSSTATA